MSSLVALVLAVVLAFSYKIVDITVGVIIGGTLYRKIENEIIYIWGILLTINFYMWSLIYFQHITQERVQQMSLRNNIPFPCI